jgi:hypothetical protein
MKYIHTYRRTYVVKFKRMNLFRLAKTYLIYNYIKIIVFNIFHLR